MKTRLCALTFMLAVFAGLPPAVRADGPITIGVNGSGPLALDAHVGWIRSGDYWSNINPAPGQWNFGNADAIVDGARSQGQQVLFILSGAPAWCSGASNGNTPCEIGFWQSYVDQVSSHFSGRVAAYEIWNEPDLQGNNTYGVGWDRDLNVSPTYADYLVEASRIIRRNDPNAKVVGPVVSGKPNSRTTTLFQQLENTYYPDGNASDFVDIISGHMDNIDAAHSDDAARFYKENILDIIAANNPRNRWKEMWITEFSWRSAGSGEDFQRKRIRNFLIEMTCGAYGYLCGYNFTHGFIYALRTCDSSRGIYYCEGNPKLVVTQYLWTLPFPAVQQTGAVREHE
jgi:polysaccharide biosynthesis protein PslG